MTKKELKKESNATADTTQQGLSGLLKAKLNKIKRHPVFKKLMIIMGASLAVLAMVIFFFNVAYGQKIFPKTYIGGINLGGQTKDQAELTLREAMTANKEKKVALAFEEQNFNIEAADLDLIYEPQESAKIAWGVGRAGKIQKILAEQLRAIFSRNQYPASFNYNEDKLKNRLDKIAQIVDVSEKNATIIVDQLIPKIEPEQTGRQTDIPANTPLVLSLFGELAPESKNDLIVKILTPQITQTNIKETYDQTNLILKNEIVFEAENRKFTLTPEDFAHWLEFVPTKNKTLEIKVNEEKANQYIESIATEIFQETKDAKFEMKNDRAVAFQSSQTGYELDKTKAFVTVKEAILNRIPSAKLAVNVTEPDISSSSASTYGIKELVGEGKTSWRGSPKNRIHNLKLGAENISGTMVKPGEEFSTLKALGPITAEAGFLPELVIKNGTQVVPDIGGGLCQVSSTLFRAALNAGLKITARTAHSFRVPYYEPPIGIDATIFDPAPDLKFVNNMDAPILIWAAASDTDLIFQIYGTKDDRKVEISDPVLFNYIAPGDPIYTESSTMEPGAIRQVERATSGVTASFKYKVTAKSGEVLQAETYVSKYIPIPDSFLYGPGAEVPAPPPASE